MGGLDEEHLCENERDREAAVVIQRICVICGGDGGSY